MHYIAEQFTSSPLGTVVIGVALTALVTIAIAAVRLLLTIPVIVRDVAEVRSDIKELKDSKDIMRYSDQRQIGRMQTQPRQQWGRRD